MSNVLFNIFDLLISGKYESTCTSSSLAGHSSQQDYLVTKKNTKNLGLPDHHPPHLGLRPKVVEGFPNQLKSVTN